MAEVDPKELLLANKALLVAYALALLPIPAWLLVVGDVKSDTKKGYQGQVNKLRQSKNMIQGLHSKLAVEKPPPGQQVYTQTDVDNLANEATVLETQIVALRKTISDRDANLEKWFNDEDEEFKDPNALPEVSTFKDHWNEIAIPALKKPIAEGGYAEIIENEGNPDRPNLFTDAPNAKNKLKPYMKRFWIQKYVLESLKNGCKRGEGEAIVIPRLRDTMSINPDKAKNKDALYEVFKVDLHFTCSFRDIPNIVRELTGQPIPMQITRLNVTKMPFRIFMPGIENPSGAEALVDGTTKGVISVLVPTAELKETAAFDPNLEHYIPEPRIDVRMEIEALDFKLPKRAAPPPPPPAGGG